MAANSVGSDLSWRQLLHGDKPFLVALFLVKSKLAHISIQEYLSRLRLFIRGCRRPAGDDNIHRHIDTINFWRDAYTKLEAAQSALRDRIFELEQSKEDLNARCKAFSGVVPESSSQRKRKRNIADTLEVPATMAAKRSRSAATSILQGSATTCSTSITSGIESSLPDFHAAAFLRYVSDVQRMSAMKKPDADSLARTLRSCASCIIALLRSSRSTQAIDNLPETRSAMTRSMMTTAAPAETRQRESRWLVIGSVFGTLTRGLDILEEDIEGLRLQGSVTYSIVDVFREILVQIHGLATASARRYKEQRDTTIAKSRRGHPKQTSVATIPRAQRPVDEQSFELSHLAIRILESLDRSKPAHIGIMEGCLYFLLQSVGKVLEVFVFGEHQSDTWSAELPGDPPGEPLRNTSTSITDLSVAECEASYLIQILQLAVAFRTPRSRLLASTQRGTCTQHASLLGRSELQLQQTLLQGTFGEHTQDFLNALKAPSAPGIDLQDTEATHRQESIGEWYKQQIWRFIGWESLRDHIC